MKRHLARILFVCFVCLLGVSRTASASTITFQGEGKVGVVDIHSPSLGNVWVYAGELEWLLNGTGSIFYTYCVDANHWALNTETVNILPSSSLSNPGVADAGGKAAWLVDTYAPWVHDFGTGDDAAGLQVAIWTALYDTGTVLNSGPFYLISASAAITTKAQTFLNALYSAPGPSGSYYTASATFYDAPVGYGQDQMSPLATPEPASLVLLGTGLTAALMRRRKRSASPPETLA